MSKISSKIIAILLAVICMVVLIIVSMINLPPPPVQKININPMNIAFVIVILAFIYLYERKVLKGDDH